MHAAINHASELQNAFALKYNNYYTLFHVYSLHQFLKYLEIHFSCMQSLKGALCPYCLLFMKPFKLMM